MELVKNIEKNDEVEASVEKAIESEIELESEILEFYNKLLAQSSAEEREALKDALIEIASDIKGRVSKLKTYTNSDSPLIKPVLKSIEEKSLGIKRLAEELMEPFLLFIVGMGNYGKSTLVNSLITREVADIDVMPKTWKIDIYTKAEGESRVKIRKNDDSLEKYSLNKAKNLIEKEEEKRIESEDLVYEKLEKLGKRLKSIEAKEELQQKLNQNLLYKSPITEAYWPCKVGELSLLNDFNIVDTPGLWQESNGERTNKDLRDYYHKADGVLWLLDANTLASAESNQLLKNLEESINLVGGKVDNVIAVLNRIDLIRQGGGAKDVRRIIEKAEKIYADTFLDIIPLSAKEGLEAIKNNDMRAYTQSGLTKLRSAIDINFVRNSSEVKAKSKIRGLKGYLRDINQEIDQYLERLKKDNQKRKALIKELEKEVKQQNQKIESLIDSKLKKYKQKVSNNIDLKAEQLFNMDQDNEIAVEKFIKYELFEVGYLENQLSDLQKRYKKILDMSTRKLAEKSRFKEFKYIDKETSLVLKEVNSNFSNQEILNYEDISDKSSIGNFLTVVAGGIFLGPVGVVLALIANAFNLVGFVVKKIKLPGIKKELNKEVDKVGTKVKREVMKRTYHDIDSFKRTINRIRRGSFSELHLKPEKVEETISELESIKKFNREDIEYEYNILDLLRE